MWLQRTEMVLNPPQVEAHLRFRALLEDCHFSSLRSPRAAGFGAPCLARVCLRQTQSCSVFPYFLEVKESWRGSHSLGPQSPGVGRVLFSFQLGNDSTIGSGFHSSGGRGHVWDWQSFPRRTALSFSWSE